ncbi:MAG TPA: GMC oxidoreductase [Solirubrobacterales bacterium]|nr:GMC oxidoreductase [Solirubrobacterales bacterium]
MPAPPAIRLASSPSEMKDRYDVVVVGSGYGGGIAASRLSRAGRSVAVIERGREVHPGDYPDNPLDVIPNLQIDSPLKRVGGRSDLYDLRLNHEVNVFVGCGLGGTSLVNAGVALHASKWVFDDERWPAELRGGVADEWYDRATEMLAPARWPYERPLAKLAALDKAGDSVGLKGERPPINVNLEPRVNHVGILQGGCVGCGDCMTGCNYAAKNTVLETYLPDAAAHGAQLFCEAAVRYVEREGDHWVVHVEELNPNRDDSADETTIIAGVVVLAAGTLGSTEILLRSRGKGLALSNALGTRFSTNGDSICFAYGCTDEIDAVGSGRPDNVGPTIAGMIDDRKTSDPEKGLMIQEGSLAGGIAGIASALLKVASTFVEDEAEPQKVPLETDDGIRAGDAAAMQRTLPFLVFGHDAAEGEMRLEDDRLRIVWPNVGDDPVFRAIDARGRQLTEGLDGTFITNPVWSKVMGYDAITVHPLGGCPLGDNAERGVVNNKGQVFAGETGSDVYDDLYVADGSIIPRALGVNPHLTICALAERSIALLAKDRGWKIDYTLEGKPPPRRPSVIGITFTESMHGFWSKPEPASDTGGIDDLKPFERAAATGKSANRELRFDLHVTADDYKKTINNKEHEARLDGMLSGFEDEPMRAAMGTWNCFYKTEDPQVRRMDYRFTATSQEGERFHFDGFKVIHDDFGPDMWRDTTTLYVTIRRGDTTGPVAALGVMTLNIVDFLEIVSRIRAIGAPSAYEAAKAKLSFSRWFVGTLRDVYGLNM